MKKSFGFTLAEILITLGVVGVVAALTLPTFSTDSKKQSYAKSLAVAVSDFETAMKNMIEREDVNNIKETQAWINCNGELNADSSNATIEKFISDINEYLPIASHNTNERSYRLLNSSDTDDIERINLKTKKGFEYKLNIHNYADNKSENDALQNGLPYIQRVASVSIDVNGNNPPNMYGRDLFLYILGSDGALYPVGGHVYNFYNNVNGGVANDLSNGCNGEDCGEYLRQNGYKMDY